MDYVAYIVDSSNPLDVFNRFTFIYGDRVTSLEWKSRFKKKNNLHVREFRFDLGLYGLD